MTYPIQTLPKASHKTTTTKNLARGGSIEGFVWQHPWPHARVCRGGRCLEKFRKLPFFFKQYGSIKHEQTVYMFLYCQGSKAPSQKELRLPFNKVHFSTPHKKCQLSPREKKTNQLKQQWKAWLSFLKKIRCFFLPAYGFPNHRNSLKP